MLFFLFLLLSSHLGQSVKHENFRKCKDTGFCKRLRLKDNPDFVPQDYELVLNTINIDGASLTADIKNNRYPLQDPLELKVGIIQNGVVRFGVREKQPLFPRWEVQDVLLSEATAPLLGAKWTTTAEGATIAYGKNILVTLQAKPLQLSLSINGQKAIVLNERKLLMLEPHRQPNPKPTESPPAEGEAAPAPAPAPESLKYPYDVDGMWDERFGSHEDSKPRGPSALSLDATFVGAQHIYGIPEHASTLALKNTIGGGDKPSYDEPYRLWNLDVFEYELDVPMALYGAVPFVISHDADKTTGMLWLNSAETFVDISESKSDIGNPQKEVHWISESGVIDAFLFPGPTPAALFDQYSTLTGRPAMPQRFAIGYHQCRWNYKSEQDVQEVDAGFDEHDIPYDVIWLDIEHTDGKKYFTWDKVSFPTPIDMQNKIAAKSRKMVTIVDPHIKRDGGYWVHTEAESRDLYVKSSAKKGGGTYEGWCWPGSVSYLDFTAPHVRDYWASLFALDKYVGSTKNLYIWNDMNEPSVFNGPEVTMYKDNTHLAGTVEHRDVHNVYGFYHQMATQQGLIQRDNARPFVLTRSFFAGSQRYGAVWTGDNRADWKHLGASVPMLLSLNVAGIVFSGADVGGFFGDPDTELLIRWYQAGAYQPFFRGHAHIDAKRREPWLFGEPTTTHIRNAIRTRYAYLPYIYTIFRESNLTGMPVMRPLWVEFPEDEETFGLDDQFLLGSALLVKPVSSASQTSTSVFLPQLNSRWYDVETWQPHPGRFTLNVMTPLSKTPVFQRGGSIIPKRERARRNSALMERDPFTLVVALDPQGKADGALYLDDGHSFNYLKGDFIHRVFRFENDKLVSTKFEGKKDSGAFTNPSTIERIVVVGAQKTYSKVILDHNSKKTELVFTQTSIPSSSLSKIVVRKPDVPISSDFTISFE